MAPRTWLMVCLLGLCAQAHALEAPASYRCRIHHEVFGDIDEHRMTVARKSDAIVVKHAAELAVQILGLTAFQRRTRFREVWRGERLVEFDGLVEDNGEPFPVRAGALGDVLIIEGSAGRIEAPAAAAPSEPSLEFAIWREWFFDGKTGELLTAKAPRPGAAQGWRRRGRGEQIRDHGRPGPRGLVRPLRGLGAAAPVAPGRRDYARAGIAPGALQPFAW